jgi:hypothetical protein
MYAKFKEYHGGFMEKDKLVQLFHEWDTDAVEPSNKLLTKFLPKDRKYCNTIRNKARSHLALVLQRRRRQVHEPARESMRIGCMLGKKSTK